MAVIIQNMSEESGLTYGKGKQVYLLSVNNEIKCYFYHNFEDGLAECLRKGAEACDRADEFERRFYDTRDN